MYLKMLKEIYRADPLGVSNIAFWKLEDFLTSGQVHYAFEEGYHHLSIVMDKKLFFYYSWKKVQGRIVENKTSAIWNQDKLLDLDFYILNDNQKQIIQPEGQFEISSPLRHQYTLERKLPEGCSYRPFDFQRDLDAAADLINRVYGYSYTAESLIKYTKSPAFEPDLWVWIEQAGQKVALGIGDFHPEMGEGSLDWIQVDPDHHGKGLGGILVTELVERIKFLGGYCRVTGMSDAFYERCGFVKGTTWYIYDNRK